MLVSHGLRQGIDKPTRLDNRLDHLMFKTRNIVKTFVFEPLTDNSSVLLYLKKLNTVRSYAKHYKTRL